MDFLNPLANQYSEKYSNSTPDYLREMYEATTATHAHAHLQSSWTQGGFLSFISTLVQPTYILEIGTFTGFSSLCLAQGLSPLGCLHTIELREQDAFVAQGHFENSPVGKKIISHVGDAKTIIPSLQFKWDIVFIDADKTSYIEYYKMVLPQLNQSGIIIADNVLFHGDVLESNISGKSAKAIQAFNDYVLNDSSTEQVMLTVRDGLTLIRKK